MLKRKHEEPEDLEKIMETVVDKAFSRLKSPEMIQVSSLSESKAKMIIEYYRIKSFKDVHTQNYQRNLQTANTILTGGTDISIGPSATSCIWIETNKNKESFKLGQAIGELLIMDNETFLDMLGKTITYQTNLPKPLKKRTKFLPPISEKDDERMGDIIDDMMEKELRNMTMRKRLRLAKSIVRIEEHPIIDQLIGQFSDDYESLM
ncbi:hypothetical protein F8M41_002577 [Gigaspora margarita]|uniref:Uncharacterized protein n=1 Tax=Gigaspora margarita TaxID=4874 RepID=A0A8H4AYH3_GIGMA|nr:hypothetical protein F8M41_002577 [Gigaspora margarita]